MNPFGFALRWLDRRIAGAIADQQRKLATEATSRAAADTMLAARIDRLEASAVDGNSQRR